MEDKAGMELSPSTVPSRTLGKRPMATRRSTVPMQRLNGVSVPVHVLEMLKEIVELENEAYVAMGGQSKGSVSDHLAAALEGYVRDWLHDNGAVPSNPAERREYVKKLAARNLEKLREQLLTKQ